MDRFESLEFDSNAGVAGQQGKDDQAQPRVQPMDGPSCARAGADMREAGFFRSAASYYHKALGFNDQDYASWVGLVDSLVRAGDIAHAEAASEEALGNYGKVRPLYAVRALVLAHKARFDEADPLLRVALEAREPAWYALCVAGEVALRQDPHAHDEAQKRFMEAVDRAGWEWEAAYLGGWALLDAHKAVLAAGYFAEAAHMNPGAAAAWLGLADAFHALRLHDQACFYYDRVLELEPSHHEVRARRESAVSRIYGLMTPFGLSSLRRRWQREYARVRQEPGRRR